MTQDSPIPGRGLFITFEGGEGSGKSTQTRRLGRRLRGAGYRVKLIREPGGTTLGDILRRVVTSPKGGLVSTKEGRIVLVEDMHERATDKDLSGAVEFEKLALPISSVAELFLFAASRAQLVEQVIAPSLKSGISVICDRYADSTLVYQGFAKGLDRQLIKAVNRLATEDLWPQLTVLLDIDPETGLARRGRSGKINRFEEEELAFHQKVRRGYLHLAATEPQRWLVVDATLPQKRIEELIWQRVSMLLPRRSKKPK